MGEISELGDQFRSAFGTVVPDLKIIAKTTQADITKVKEVLKADAITTEAYSVAWGKIITAKNVTFPQGDNTTTWGVEFNIPLEFNQARFVYENLVNRIERDRGFQIPADIKQQNLAKIKDSRYYNGPSNIKLPEKIKSIKILDLAPQEILDKKDRNIPSHRSWYHEKHPIRDIVRRDKDKTAIDRVVSVLFKEDLGAHTRVKALNNLFKDLFGPESRGEIERFLFELDKSDASEIVFIHAHGGKDEVIGEESMIVKRDQDKQNPGNRIHFDQVLDRYDDPSKTAAILLVSCYIGKDSKRPVKKVPVFSVDGLSGRNREFIGQFIPSKTSVSLPPNS